MNSFIIGLFLLLYPQEVQQEEPSAIPQVVCKDTYILPRDKYIFMHCNDIPSSYSPTTFFVVSKTPTPYGVGGVHIKQSSSSTGVARPKTQNRTRTPTESQGGPNTHAATNYHDGAQ